MFHLASRFILAITLLLGFFVLRNGQFLVVLILPGLLLTSLLCWCMAAWIHRKTAALRRRRFSARWQRVGSSVSSLRNSNS